jgi:hypothetical protein
LRPAALNTARFIVVGSATLDDTFTNLAAYKIASTWSANDFASCFNGGTLLTDVSGAVSAGLTTLYLGCGAPGTTTKNGHIRRFDYYPTRLSNAFLVGAST